MLLLLPGGGEYVFSALRSAGFQPAVSQACSLRALEKTFDSGLGLRHAEWNSAIQQTASLRYAFWQILRNPVSRSKPPKNAPADWARWNQSQLLRLEAVESHREIWRVRINETDRAGRVSQDTPNRDPICRPQIRVSFDPIYLPRVPGAFDLHLPVACAGET